MGRPKEDPEKRFWAKIKKCDDCWMWTAGTDKDGYGKFQWDGETKRAHRFSYTFFRGPIPTGLFVCHSCDRPGCVNPEHLWLGTTKDNSADMKKKGRAAKGDKNGANWYWKKHPERHVKGENVHWTKLTEANVREIRKSTDIHRVVAKRFGVSRALVSMIQNKKVWRHI